MCESMGKQVPPNVGLISSIIIVVDRGQCQTSIRKVKALDIQMLINAPPLQPNA